MGVQVVLSVALGGACGAVARYGVSSLAGRAGGAQVEQGADLEPGVFGGEDLAQVVAGTCSKRSIWM